MRAQLRVGIQRAACVVQIGRACRIEARVFVGAKAGEERLVLFMRSHQHPLRRSCFTLSAVVDAEGGADPSGLATPPKYRVIGVLATGFMTSSIHSFEAAAQEEHLAMAHARE